MARNAEQFSRSAVGSLDAGSGRSSLFIDFNVFSTHYMVLVVFRISKGGDREGIYSGMDNSFHADRR